MMNKIKIQIVEDEYIMAKYLTNQLVKLGYDVFPFVTSGEEAISQIESKRPDLVLMDIKLKGEMDGIEAARVIRSLYSIPVIYLTAHSDESMLKRAKLTEPFGCLLKPVELRELNIAVEVAVYKNKIEKQLRESKSWLLTTLKSIGDGVIATDANARIMFMNPVAQELTGVELNAALGKTLRDFFMLFDEVDDKPVDIQIDKVLKEGILIHSSKRTVLAVSDGRRIPIDYRMAPIKNEKGNVIGIVLIFQNITERRQWEVKMREMEKLQFLGQIVSGVAHEVRNPLNAIQATTEALAQDLDENAEHKTFLSYIRTQVNHLALLMKDLLELGKPIQESSFQKESLPAICSSAIELWKETTTYDTHIDHSIHPYRMENLEVFANGSKLQQVILNLLENAAQHSPKGSKVELYLQYHDDNWLSLRVVDSGDGIPPENLTKIFEPFYTTRSVGVGLGLSLVKRIVENHGGEVKVKNNEPPPGCTVEILLPIANEEIL